jgi:glycerophosphoryl diester phosphodiesterase
MAPRQGLIFVLIGVMVLALAACSRDLPHEMQDGVSLPPGKDILVVGHRGAAGLAPENTLAAFATGLRLGVAAVELDVQLARDGELVVYHDLTLKPETTRNPDGEWLGAWTGLALKDLSLAELKSYDVGRIAPHTLYARRYPEQIPVDGETIPTLPEVIDLVRDGGPTVELWIEIKTSPLAPRVSSRPEDVAAAVVRLLRREGFTDRAKILAFDWRALHRVRQLAPEMATVYLTNTSRRMDTVQKGQPGPSPWTAGLDVDQHQGSLPALVAAAGGRFWAPRHNQITPEDLAEARRRNIQIYVWAPDSDTDLRRSIGLGVDGIITNRPDRLMALLNPN